MGDEHETDPTDVTRRPPPRKLEGAGAEHAEHDAEHDEARQVSDERLYATWSSRCG